MFKQITRRWHTFWDQHDPDDVFSYSTIKMLTIRDRRLGLLHLLFMAMIVFYILGIVLIRDKQYLDTEEPVGSVTMSATLANALKANKQPYCSQCPTAPSGNAGPAKLTCLNWDSYNAMYPLFEQSAMFLTSRLSVLTQNSSCDLVGDECAMPFIHDEKSDYYVAQLEDFKIQVSHSVQAPTFSVFYPWSHSYRGQSVSMAGEFISNTTTGAKRKLPSGSADVFSVKDFLDAAGVSLDNVADVLDSPIDKPSFRYTGLVLVVSIVYKNFEPKFPPLTGPDDEISYTYRVVRVQETMFRVLEIKEGLDHHKQAQSKASATLDVDNPAQRRIYDRHGVRLIFVQSGTLGRFHFQTLMIQLVTSLALIKLSVSIVDLLSTKFMPQREHYRKYKYQLTQDFSDIRDRLQEEKQVKKSYHRPLLMEKYGDPPHPSPNPSSSGQ